MADTALGQIADQTSVFARVAPIQKQRIILALRARGRASCKKQINVALVNSEYLISYYILGDTDISSLSASSLSA